MSKRKPVVEPVEESEDLSQDEELELAGSGDDQEEYDDEEDGEDGIDEDEDIEDDEEMEDDDDEGS
jgi:hypothetical protein